MSRERRIPRVACCVLAVALTGALTPAAASATNGTTKIDLGGKAFKQLRAHGVRITAKRPARLSRGVVRLPVRRGLVSSVALLNHGGAIRLRRRAGKRRATVLLRQLQVRLARRSSVRARIGARRLKIFTIRAPRRKLALDRGAGTASLRRARLVLTRAGARAIEHRLRLRRLPAARIGRITVDARVSKRDRGGRDGGAARPLPRPASAVDIRSASVTWHLRDSWIRYVTTERAVQALGGAVPGAPVRPEAHPCPDSPAGAGAPPLVYSYSLPFARGWHDPGSGRTDLRTRGGLRFRFPSHGIDFTTRDLEIQLDGSKSRVTAAIEGRRDTPSDGTRRVLLDLAAPGPGPAPASGERTTLGAAVPTAAGEGLFAGFYGAGDGFGCVTVSYNT